MANTFKRVLATGAVTEATIYTVPASTTAMVMEIRAADSDGVNDTVTLKHNTYFIANAVVVPANAAVNLIDSRLIMETGDTLKLTCGAATSTDVVVSFMEIT